MRGLPVALPLSTLLWALIIYALIALAGAVSPASSHSWYPPSCCSGFDCRPIPASEVQWTQAGWLIRATGEVIPEMDPKARWSEDGDFHRCSPAYRPRGGMDYTICLFVPGAGA